MQFLIFSLTFLWFSDYILFHCIRLRFISIITVNWANEIEYWGAKWASDNYAMVSFGSFFWSWYPGGSQQSVSRSTFYSALFRLAFAGNLFLFYRFFLCLNRFILVLYIFTQGKYWRKHRWSLENIHILIMKFVQ